MLRKQSASRRWIAIEAETTVVEWARMVVAVATEVSWSTATVLQMCNVDDYSGGGYGRNQGGSWNRMNQDNNNWNNNWNNDNYSDNSQWNSNSPWDNSQGQNWGNGSFNQNWSNDSFGSGYQQNYSGGAQPSRGYSGNNRMVPYSNQSKFVELFSDS